MAGARTAAATVFAMPSLGADMDEGRVVEWLIAPGDHVERGQIVVVVETEKSDIEVEVFEAATVGELLVGEGEQVAVGTPIATMLPDQPASHRQETTHVPSAPMTIPTTIPTTAPTPTSTPTSTSTAAPAPASTMQPAAPVSLRSPVLRHLAEELHVDPARVHGSGPGGRIGRTDIESAARDTERRVSPRARWLLREQGVADGLLRDLPGDRVVTGDDVIALGAQSTPVDADTAARAADRAAERRAAMRRHIAGLMQRSWHEIPHFHVAKRLDLSPANERLTAINEDRPPAERIVPGALLLCAAARAAAATPECNGWWRDDAFEPADRVELGVVLSLRTGGIIVPTIADADRMTPDEMMARLAELVQRARQGRLRGSDLGTASITVTSLGDRGGDAVFGVIHPPQVALVGFGAVRDELWPDGDGGAVRPTVDATLTGDHRAIDGLVGSRYLTRVQRLLDRTLIEELEAT